MTDEDPLGYLYRIERKILKQEYILIEIEVLNFVYWNDRWPVSLIYCEGPVGPPTILNDVLRKWVRFGHSHRYFCLE
jgi:hypothetical protein